MKAGDLTPMSSCTVIYGSGEQVGLQRVTYKAKPGRRMVFMFLGDEPKSGEPPLDGLAVLDALGWQVKRALPQVSG